MEKKNKYSTLANFKIDVLNNFIPGGEKHKIDNIKGYSWDTKNLLDTCKKIYIFLLKKKKRKIISKIGIKKMTNLFA